LHQLAGCPCSFASCAIVMLAMDEKEEGMLVKKKEQRVGAE
jgi:hypothetical protein